MKRMTTTVSYKVPKGWYCNHTMHKSTPLTRCRFCTDLGKGVFTCVLYNEPLTVTEGALIHKAEGCYNKQGIVEDAPTVKPKELIAYALKTYRKTYLALINQGIPEEMAHKAALEEVTK